MFWLQNPDTDDCQRTGEVVYITSKKENRIIVGCLLVERGLNYRYSSLIPKDHRFPKLLVDTSNWPTPIALKDGSKESVELFYAILPKWDNYKFPIGYASTLLDKVKLSFIIDLNKLNCCFRILKEALGESGEINAETQGILVSHDIQEDPYPKDVDQYFPPPFSVEEELKHRKDFRLFKTIIILRSWY